MESTLLMFAGDLVFACVTSVCVTTIVISLIRGLPHRRRAAMQGS